MVPFDEIENFYAIGDIFVSGSTSETQGLTYVEALASGLILLVREDECLSEVLREGENGISYRDEQGFQTALETLLDSAEKFSREGIQASVESYSSDGFAGKVQELYQRTIGKYQGRKGRGRTRRRYRRRYLRKKSMQHEEHTAA
jgi:1,2-diacylglycerol 3-alpha-glucosyltransferase